MFDRLEDLLIRFEELMSELSEPDVANNPDRFRRLMKEQSDLTPIVEAYKEYKQCKQDIEDSLMMLEEESDEEISGGCLGNIGGLSSVFALLSVMAVAVVLKKKR